VPHRAGTFIDAFVPTMSFVAVDEHSEGSGHVRVHDLKSGKDTVLPLDDAAGYMAAADDWRFPKCGNTDPAATSVRVGYMSMVVPKQSPSSSRRRDARR